MKKSNFFKKDYKITKIYYKENNFDILLSQIKFKNHKFIDIYIYVYVYLYNKLILNFKII